MRNKVVLLLYIALLTLSAYSQTEQIPTKGFVSWLPAAKWEDALLTGNGTLGAMVMGNPFEETIILNHALLYLPGETPVIPPDMTPYKDEIKKLSLEGKYKEVAELGVQIWKEAGYGDKKWTDPYVPAANITIDMPAYNVGKYRRMVNYETAEAIVEWTDETGSFTRKTFASRKDGVIVTLIKGTAPFTAEIALQKHPHSWEQNAMINSSIKVSETKVEDGLLHYHVEYGKPHSHSPTGYDGLLKVINKGGKVVAKGNRLLADHVNEVLILTDITPYKESNKVSVTTMKEHLNAVSNDYAGLLKNQVETHGALYNRVSLQLGATEKEKEFTSETFVSRVRENSSPGLLQRQFEAARYHIICSSGINPPNLQGIWSGTWDASLVL